MFADRSQNQFGDEETKQLPSVSEFNLETNYAISHDRNEAKNKQLRTGDEKEDKQNQDSTTYWKSFFQSILKKVNIFNIVVHRKTVPVMILIQAGSLFLFGESSGKYGFNFSLDLVFTCFFGLFACFYCEVLNDITDIEVDRINHPKRPLVSGKATIQDAYFVLMVTFIVSIFLGFAIAKTPLSYFILLSHFTLSTLYSFPKIRLARHWILGPISLAAASLCGRMFILVCTKLYTETTDGQLLIALILFVTFIHHLLIIPLKDVNETDGDNIDNGSSFVMKVPLGFMKFIAIIGYTLPWIIFYSGITRLTESQNINPELLEALKFLAIIFVLIGFVQSFLIIKMDWLLKYQHFKWFSELGMNFIFMISLSGVGVLVQAWHKKQE